jgi:hypothetical protein
VRSIATNNIVRITASFEVAARYSAAEPRP